MATAARMTDELVEIISTMNISVVNRSELLQCLHDVSSTDGDRALYVNITDAILAAGKVKSGANFKDIVLSCMKFAEASYAILELVRPDVYPVVGRVLKVVTAICPLMFETAEDRDIVTDVMDSLKRILDDDMKHECEGVKKEIWDSVAYLTGVPPANELSREDRNIVLNGLGHGFTEKGSKLLGKIMSKIMDMVKEPSIFKFDVFMQYIELYCSLATLRLLMLLYLFAILSAYNAPTKNCVKRVLDRHRADDKNLFNAIRFLHKPRKDTLRLHLRYRVRNWKIVQNFFNNHDKLHPSRFLNKALQIFSKRDENKTLCFRRKRLMSLLRPFSFEYLHCIENADTEDVVFQFCKSENDSTFFSMNPIHKPGRYVNMEDFKVPFSYDLNGLLRNQEWRLVEMEPDAPDQISTFVIAWFKDLCLFTSCDGDVSVKSFNNSDSGFFWTLKVL